MSQMRKTTVAATIAAFAMTATALAGCGGSTSATTTLTFDVPDVGAVEVTMDNTHGYTMSDKGVFSQGGNGVAQLNFLPKDDYEMYKKEAAAETNYHKIKFREKQEGIYFEKDDMCYYVVDLDGSDGCALAIAGPDEEHVADSLNLVTAKVS